MKYAVDLIIRVMSEGEDKESAELAACQPGVDWNEGYLINLDSIPEEHILKCDHCHVEFRFSSFREFWDELGPRPAGRTGKSSTYSLERINNMGHYEKGNVRWATRKEQGNNKRTNVKDVDVARVLQMVREHPDKTYQQLADLLGCHISFIGTHARGLRGQGRPRWHGLKLKGQRFSHWLVIGDSVKEGGYCKSLCRCDCGTERLVRHNNLTSGGSTNCGCIKADQTACWTPERRAHNAAMMKRQWKENPDALRQAQSARRKLTMEQVREIRRLYVPGVYGYNRLADRFGVSPGVMEKIIAGRTYKELDAEGRSNPA